MQKKNSQKTNLAMLTIEDHMPDTLDCQSYGTQKADFYIQTCASLLKWPRAEKVTLDRKPVTCMTSWKKAERFWAC